MKKILKILIETFLKSVVYILGKINPGRYILDELNKNIIKKKEIIVYKDLKLIFYVPNRLSHFRVNTLLHFSLWFCCQRNTKYYLNFNLFNIYVDQIRFSELILKKHPIDSRDTWLHICYAYR